MRSLDNIDIITRLTALRMPTGTVTEPMSFVTIYRHLQFTWIAWVKGDEKLVGYGDTENDAIIDLKDKLEEGRSIF